MSTGSSTNIGAEKLIARGISAAAIAQGWVSGDKFWRYPLLDTDERQVKAISGLAVHRYKNFDSSANPKYFVKPNQADDAWPAVDLYVTKGLRAALTESKGVAYLASGEPDVLTLLSAKHANVIAAFGEANFARPETFEDVKALGILSLMTWPDLDDTGRRSVAANYLFLKERDISLQVSLLPWEMLGDGGDLNKLWVKVGFDWDKFEDELACSRIVEEAELLTWLPPSKPVEIKTQAQPTLFERGADKRGEYWTEKPTAKSEEEPAWPGAPKVPPPGSWEAAEEACGVVSAYDNDGWTKNYPSPFCSHEHDHKNGAFALNNQSWSWRCQKCAPGTPTASGHWKELFELLKIDWRSYIPKKERPPVHPAPKLLAPKAEGKPGFAIIRASEVQAFNPVGLPAIPMPYPSLRNKIGGFFRTVSRGKVILVVGGSGGNKTVFSECLDLRLRLLGYNSTRFNNEWSPEEQEWRLVQKLGGPYFISSLEHDSFLKWQQKGCPPSARYKGVEYQPQEYQRFAEAMKQKQNILGESYLVDRNFSTGYKDVLAQMDAHCEDALSRGKHLDYAIWDYMQVSAGDGVDPKEIFMEFKAFCVRRDLVGFMLSQTDKINAAAIKAGEKVSTQGGWGFQDWYANGTITIIPIYNEAGERQPKVKLAISKNSVGTDGVVELILDTQRWTIDDPEDVKRGAPTKAGLPVALPKVYAEEEAD